MMPAHNVTYTLTPPAEGGAKWELKRDTNLSEGPISAQHLFWQRTMPNTQKLKNLQLDSFNTGPRFCV